MKHKQRFYYHETVTAVIGATEMEAVGSGANYRSYCDPFVIVGEQIVIILWAFASIILMRFNGDRKKNDAVPPME
jgi:hypothetical protein